MRDGLFVPLIFGNGCGAFGRFLREVVPHVFDGEHGVRKKKTRTRPAHDVAGARFLRGAIAVNLASGAGGLVRPVGTAGKALEGVSEKFAAVVAEFALFRAVVRVTEARDHRFERSFLFIEPRNGLEAGHAVDALRSQRRGRLVFGRVCHAVSLLCCRQGLKEERQYSVTK